MLAPIMPYSLYKFWDEDDLRAIYAYLKSIPAVSRTTPAVGFEPVITSYSIHYTKLYDVSVENLQGLTAQWARKLNANNEASIVCRCA